MAISGLPGGVDPDAVTTPEGGSAVSVLVGDNAVAPGPYTLVGRNVAGPASTRVRKAYASAPQSVCVPAGAAVSASVTYAAIATSGYLWTTNGSGGTTPMHGFDAPALASTATVGSSLEADTRDAKGFVFDKDGNLWVVGGTTADPQLSRYLAASVPGANRNPDISITITGTGCSPGISQLAFDSSGNLWIAMGCQDRVVRLTPADLAQSGTVAPVLVLSGVDFPSELAFDGAGNLWVVADGPNGTLHQYTTAQLAAGATAPAQSLSLTATGSATAADADAIAFDAVGDAWVTASANYNLAKLTAAQLIGTGIRPVAPTQYISVGVGALPERAAIDDAGGVWIAGAAGKLGRLAPSQQGTDTTYAAPTTPEVVITGSDLGYPGTLGFFPAAAGLPLPHALP